MVPFLFVMIYVTEKKKEVQKQITHIGANDVLLGTLFENVDSCMIRLLKEVSDYQELKKKREELWQKYPFINSLYDSYESMSLTEEQHRILRDEMELSLAISQYERKEYFWIGQQYVLEYLEWMKERCVCC